MIFIKQYGSGFELRSLRRMIQFAELFPDLKIVSPLATHLSWSHFIEILPLETEKARLFYANEAVTRQLGKRELRNQISRKAYERREIGKDISERNLWLMIQFYNEYQNVEFLQPLVAEISWTKHIIW